MVTKKSLPTYEIFQQHMETLLLILIFLLGLYARFPDFPQPYLWLDEAWRALAITSCNSPQSLIEYMSQDSQVLLLSEWVTGKIALFLIPDKSLALRIIPLLFSSVCFISIFQFSKAISKSSFALLPVLLISGGYSFVFHTREFKPYIIDLTFTCMAYCLTVFLAQEYHARLEHKNTDRQINKHLFPALTIILVIFAFSSLISIFIFPALLLFLLFKKLPRKKLFILSVSSFLPFLINYLIFLYPQSPGGTQDFWSSYYLHTNLDNFNFFVQTWIQFISQYTAMPWKIVTLSFFIILPCFSIYKKDGIFLLFLVPFFMQCIFSYLKLYPLFERPSYYLYGLAVISLCYSLSSIMQLIYIQGLKIFKRQNTYNYNQPRLNYSYLSYDRFFCILIMILTLAFTNFSGQIKGAKRWPVDQGRQIMAILEKNYDDSDYLVYNYASYFTLKYYSKFPQSSSKNLALNEKIANFSRKDSINDYNLNSIDDIVSSNFLRLKYSKIWILSTHTLNATQNYLDVLKGKGKIRVYLDKPYQRLISLEPYEKV